VSGNLVFITGGSSGIGLALARTVPFEDAQIYEISRRGHDDYEHIPADLANPESWDLLGDFFMQQLDGFGGECAVFIHCAGTLDPIGFAGEVSASAYKLNVLLNSAAPQILGDAFLDAARRTRAQCHLLVISSGAATQAYEGWSSYCAGKAAVNQWVSTVGAEQVLRGNHCRVLAVAPGIVATAMQSQIRNTSAEQFPQVARFTEMYEQGQLRDPDKVAREIWDLLDRDLPNGAFVDLREPTP
jgi:NAD(P)-dependent dehydrogenase (short-subunit alcohol dehydrogenase family)